MTNDSASVLFLKIVFSVASQEAFEEIQQIHPPPPTPPKKFGYSSFCKNGPGQCITYFHKHSIDFSRKKNYIIEYSFSLPE